MSSNLVFNAKYVVTGTADIKASGQAMTDAFNRLKNAGSPITALENQRPGGDDDAGQEFVKWYTEFKQQIVEQGAEVGEFVVELAKNVDLAVASFVKTDLDSAAALKVE
jgi:hypothetical protein